MGAHGDARELGVLSLSFFFFSERQGCGLRARLRIRGPEKPWLFIGVIEVWN